ncbi:MAG: hypothetical protein AAB692_00815 [Patescibacteria group bacterium]
MYQDFELVVGLTGLLAAGKDSFCKFLEPHGFVRTRFSDAIREEAARKGVLNPTRTQLQDLGDHMKKDDNGILAKLIVKSARERGLTKIIVNGARHPDEFRALRGAVVNDYRFVTVGITASTGNRYHRYVARGQAGDAKVTLEEFLAIDDRDRGIGQPPNGQQTDRTLAMVDWHNLFCNDGTHDQFRVWVDEWLTRTRAWQEAEHRRKVSEGPFGC